jgi:hypothetical protein
MQDFHVIYQAMTASLMNRENLLHLSSMSQHRLVRLVGVSSVLAFMIG